MINTQFVSGLISELTKMNIYKSLFFIADNEEHNSPYDEIAGYFIPKDLHGYILPNSTHDENMRRTIHEVSHGFYLENIPIGKIIASSDATMADIEVSIFGRLLKPKERILIITGTELEGIHEIHSQQENIPDDIDMSSYDSVAFISDTGLKDYSNFRKKYSEIVTSDLLNQEGFCTLMEEKVMSVVNEEFSDTIFWRTINSNDIYGMGFRKLKSIESCYGLSGVIKYLTNGGEKNAENRTFVEA